MTHTRDETIDTWQILRILSGIKIFECVYDSSAHKPEVGARLLEVRERETEADDGAGDMHSSFCTAPGTEKCSSICKLVTHTYNIFLFFFFLFTLSTLHVLFNTLLPAYCLDKLDALNYMSCPA